MTVPSAALLIAACKVDDVKLAGISTTVRPRFTAATGRAGAGNESELRGTTTLSTRLFFPPEPEPMLSQFAKVLVFPTASRSICRELEKEATALFELAITLSSITM